MTEEFAGHYIVWQLKRLNWILKHIDIEDIRGKNILELGCGHAFFGEQLSRMGANVLCVDGRHEHIAYVNRQLQNSENLSIRTCVADLDEDFSWLGVFDVLIDMGLIYHLEKPEEHIFNLTKMMHKDSLLILESIVSDYEKPLAYSLEEEGYDQSLSRKARILSGTAIENLMDTCGLEYADISSPELNTSLHQYDWVGKNSRLIQDEEGRYYRRMWLVGKSDTQNSAIEGESDGRKMIEKDKRIADLQKELIDCSFEKQSYYDKCLQLQDFEKKYLEVRNTIKELEKKSQELEKSRSLLDHENRNLRTNLKFLEKENMEIIQKQRYNAVKRVAEIVKKHSGQNKRIAIFGAGEHTAGLFRPEELKALSPKVILDNDRSKWSLQYQNIPIHNPCHANQLNLDVIIISSEKFEEEIRQQLRDILFTDVVIETIYAD